MTKAGASIPADLGLLLRGRMRRLRGAKRAAGRAGTLRAGLAIMGGLMFTGGLYAGAYRFLYWIIARTDYVGGLITSVLLDYLLLIAVAILVLSTFIAALAEVLLSDDLALLRAAPLRDEALYLDRLIAVWLRTAWMPLTFVVPVLLGFAKAWTRLIAETPGTGSETDLFALGWLMLAGLPALTFVPAAASCMAAMIAGRFISAARLRNVLLAGAIIGGIGLYAAGQYLRIDRVLSPDQIENFLESMRGMERSTTSALPTDWLANSIDLSLHGDLRAQGFYEDRGLAAQRTDKLLEDALAMAGDQSLLRLGVERFVYRKKRDDEPPGLLGTLGDLAAALPFVSMRPPPVRPALWPPMALFAIGLVLTVLGARLAKSSYALAYGRAQLGQPQRRGNERGPWAPLIDASRPLMPNNLAPFMSKDARIFFRDASQWTQALAIAGMIALSVWGFAAAADRASISELGKYLPNASVVIFSIGAWIGTLLTSAASARLVFPLVSMEGEGFWLVRAAPVRMARLLRAKFLLALVPTLLLGTSIAYVVCTALQFNGRMTMMVLLMALLNAAITCALGIGLGAALPDFRFDNISQLVQGPGGILFIILSMSYATLLTGFWSGFVWAEVRGSLTLLKGSLLLGVPLLVGALLAGGALHIGVRRLEALDR